MEQEIEQVAEIYNLITTYLVNYSFQIVGAAIIMMVGVLLGRKLSEVVFAVAERRGVDITLSKFFASATRIAVIGSAVVIALPKLGVQITPFIAAIGALGLGAGLAIQGLLSNYGAGLSIILTRPFVVGDTIRVQGVWGVVKEVTLAYTVLSNEDDEMITIPNRHIIGEIIHNSQADTVLELSVGIAYDSNTKRAIEIIQQNLGTVDGLSDQRPVQVGIDNFGDSSINIGIRCWVKTERFHDVKYACNTVLQEVLSDNNIAIPFPQREVRLLQ
ncbi:MAG: mechanosensitive ion channel family protein [Pseudomonadales bacterium]|nr:mechanosensitive ion channel family protein [Pseudomonadales bacterium]